MTIPFKQWMSKINLGSRRLNLHLFVFKNEEVEMKLSAITSRCLNRGNGEPNTKNNVKRDRNEIRVPWI